MSYDVLRKITSFQKELLFDIRVPKNYQPVNTGGPRKKIGFQLTQVISVDAQVISAEPREHFRFFSWLLRVSKF